MNDVGKEEWGPWIEWEGGRPAVELIGLYAELRHNFSGYTVRGRIVRGRGRFGHAHKSFLAPKGGVYPDIGAIWEGVERYRIRKPRGMQLLRSILTETEVDEDA